jgi:hypothetical protein
MPSTTSILFASGLILFGVGCSGGGDAFELSFEMPRPDFMRNTNQEVLQQKASSAIFRYYGKFPCDETQFISFCKKLKLEAADKPYFMGMPPKADAWWDPPTSELFKDFTNSYYQGFSETDSFGLGTVATWRRGNLYLMKVGRRSAFSLPW